MNGTPHIVRHRWALTVLSLQPLDGRQRLACRFCELRLGPELSLMWASEVTDRDERRLHALIDRMHELQRSLSFEKPLTVYGANLMINAALDLLEARSRGHDSLLGFGPVQEILQQVEKALAFSSAEIPSARNSL